MGHIKAIKIVAKYKKYKSFVPRKDIPLSPKEKSIDMIHNTEYLLRDIMVEKNTNNHDESSIAGIR